MIGLRTIIAALILIAAGWLALGLIEANLDIFAWGLLARLLLAGWIFIVGVAVGETLAEKKAATDD